jgi:gamma-glutamyltranspeptidase/glutathione hydrolase
VVDAWYTLLDRWGTMSFAQVLAPAIELAEGGFPLSEGLAGAIRASEKLRKFPASAKVYFPNGEAPRAGEVFRNADLARTFKMLVEAERKARGKGRHAALKAARDRFYKGDIARKMADFSEANGGLFRYQDFAGYAAKVEDPVSSEYHGYEVYKNPSATQGPSELFTLNILRGYDLKAMGHNSADYIHVNVEAVKLAFADRELYLGDADFIKIPFAGLLSEPYAAGRRALIDMAHASHQFRPGDPARYTPDWQPVSRPTTVTLDGNADHEGDTSYLAVVDRKRNAVSWTPSLHSGFGTGVVMADLGFPFNCRGDYFSLDPQHANALEPGKRPRSTLTPTLILKDGKPFMAVGSPGGDDQCMRIMQTFLNVVEFGMNIQAAIEAPRWTTTSFPSSVFPHIMKPGEIAVEDRIPEDVRRELAARGHKVAVRGGWTLSATSAIVIDPATNVLAAGADPRGDNYALAW